jgi:hypothetical protein
MVTTMLAVLEELQIGIHVGVRKEAWYNPSALKTDYKITPEYIFIIILLLVEAFLKAFHKCFALTYLRIPFVG